MGGRLGAILVLCKDCFSGIFGSCLLPLAAKVEEFDHVTKADFQRTAPGYKECCSAFASAARVIGGRDLIEEYLAVKVWPLTRG